MGKCRLVRGDLSRCLSWTFRSNRIQATIVKLDWHFKVRHSHFFTSMVGAGHFDTELVLQSFLVNVLAPDMNQHPQRVDTHV